MRNDPHLLIEGCFIACFAMEAHACYIYVRGEYIFEADRLEAAIAQAYEARLVGKDNIHGGRSTSTSIAAPALYLRRGDGAARIARRQERHAAPQAAVPGQYGPLRLSDHRQHVESIAVAPTILRRGAAWFSSFGAKNNSGTKLFCISGHVNKPCNVEEAMSIPFAN